MKITPVTAKRTHLIPMAAILTGSATMVACQQQPQCSPGAPLPPPKTELNSGVDGQVVPESQIQVSEDKGNRAI